MNALGAGAGETQTYVYLGHGNEEVVPYDERERVPEGTTLVTFTKPGEGIEFTQTNRIISVMRTNPGLFKDPVRNKEEIEEATGGQIRIYEAGSLMPTLYYYPFNDGPGTRGHWNFYASGLYKFPLQYFDDLYGTIQTTPLTDEIVTKLYKGDLNDFLLQRVLSNEFRDERGIFSLDRLRHDLVYKASDMVARIGPGVHYFLNCRNVKGLRQKLQTFLQDLSRDLDQRREELDLHIPNIQTPYKRALEYIHQKVISQFKNDLLALQPRGVARTSENLPERKLEGIRALLQTPAGIRSIENIYENKDQRKICLMIPKTCEKLDAIEHFVLLNTNAQVQGVREIVDQVFQQENPPAFDKNIMTTVILTPIKKKYAEIFDDTLKPIQERLIPIRQMSNAGQALYTRGGKRKRKQKRRNQKTQKRR